MLEQTLMQARFEPLATEEKSLWHLAQISIAKAGILSSFLEKSKISAQLCLMQNLDLHKELQHLIHNKRIYWIMNMMFPIAHQEVQVSHNK